MTNRFSVFAALVAAFLVTVGAMADSEYDGKGNSEKAPALIIKKLDPTTKTVTTYAVATTDPNLTEEALGKLKDEERNKVIEAFLKSAEKNGKKEAEESVTKVKVEASEYDEKSSSGQWGWRWRGRYGGYYGYGGFRGYYGGGFYNYRPYFGYGGGCYNPCWQAPIVTTYVQPVVYTQPYYIVYGCNGGW